MREINFREGILMKRLIFLVLSALFLILTLTINHALNTINQERDELIRQLDTLTRLLTEAEDEKDRLQTQLNCRELLSRGGRVMDIMTPSGMSEEDMETALKGTGLEGIGEALVQAEEATGINALVLAGICAHESGWGTSRLAREKNNLAGLGAYDHSPGSAICFESREECVMFLARLLRERPGSLEEIGTWYAADPGWAAKVAGCMRVIVEVAHVIH